jgi:hypothetical protein
MEEIKVNAFFNMKEVPQTLKVTGSITTYRPDDKLELVEAESQGIIEQILILQLKFTEGTAPMKGTEKPFSYNTDQENSKDYKQVTIQYGNAETITVDVEFRG